jgi:hypothetical protein
MSAVVIDGTYVRVNWCTYSELNNDYFTVEYSYDLNNWIECSTINGFGNSNSPLYYSTVFQPTLEGYVYVRIKQTDYDGNFDYSKILSVSYNYYGEIKILYYIDIHGQKYNIQPKGLSIRVYQGGYTEKAFRI